MLFIARYCYHYYTITFSLAKLNNICWNSTADVGLYCNTPHNYLQNIAYLLFRPSVLLGTGMRLSRNWSLTTLSFQGYNCD